MLKILNNNLNFVIMKYLLINLKIFFLTILLLILMIPVVSANNKEDSLLNVVKGDGSEPERIKAYGSLIYNMMWMDTDSAAKMLDSMERWLVGKNYPDVISRKISLTGTIQWFKGNLDSAAFFYHKNIDYAKVHDLDDQYLNALSNLGALLNQLGMPDSAARYLNEALPIAQKSPNLSYLYKIHFDLGNLYGKMDFNHLSLEHLLKSEEHYKQINDSAKLIYAWITLGNTYENIGNVEKSRQYLLKALEYDFAIDKVNMISDIYNNLGVLHWKRAHNYDSGRYYIQKAIDSVPGIQQNNLLATYYSNLGGLELQSANSKTGLEYLIKARAIETNYKDDYQKSGMIINIGIAHSQLEQYDSAKYYLYSGLKLALKSSAYEFAKNAYKALFTIDSIQKKYLPAIEKYQKYYEMRDSIDNEQVRNKIAELEIIYETRKKENENQFLKTENELKQNMIQNQRIIGLLVISGLLSVIAFVFILLKNQRKLKVVNKQLELTNREVNLKNEIIRKTNSNLEEQKKKLTELNQTKDKFFSVVAHDLRSPFNVLLGYLDMLETEFDELDKLSKLDIIRTLHESSRNTYNLLVNLLEWSRSQRGHLHSNPENLALYDLANEAIQFLHQRSKDKNQVIKNEIDQNIIVYTDQNLTQSIFINLINNAIKFTPSKGQIKLTASQKDSMVECSISDTGIGIPADKMDELFKLNSEFSRNGTENEPGTGLGLILCQEFVQLINGQIWVTSIEKQGTTFYFSVPAKKLTPGYAGK
jgi:signal transduction histidine kinase